MLCTIQAVIKDVAEKNINSLWSSVKMLLERGKREMHDRRHSEKSRVTKYNNLLVTVD